MVRKLSLALALVLLTIHQPMQAQEPFSFAGKWRLTLTFGDPMEVPGAPTFTYDIEAKTSSEVLIHQGGGTVTGALEFFPAVRINGLSWRHLVDATNTVTGVSVSFELFSTRTPVTVILRGKPGNVIQGRAIIIEEAATPGDPAHVSRIGYNVQRGPFKLERLP
jgi:hypothetical protein